jgi:3-isopropylmalate/(R)-2-methylmalate dehydratase small subunit
MKPVSVVTGRAVPLERSDVDTDQIIPSDWLKRVERTGFGAGLFAEWRDDRDFVLNDPAYAGATILVAGHNFGTGSSREHAVWALTDYGFEAVVSSRFGDIFRNNCTKQGLIPVQVSEEVDQALLGAVRADPMLEITVDVARGTIEAPAAGIAASFALDDFTRERLLNGWDDIGLTLRHCDAIDRFEAGRPGWMPTMTAARQLADDDLEGVAGGLRTEPTPVNLDASGGFQ